MSEPLQGTASAANSIARVKYSHDAMIDLIIANPMIPQGQIAQHFGYTQKEPEPGRQHLIHLHQKFRRWRKKEHAMRRKGGRQQDLKHPQKNVHLLISILLTRFNYLLDIDFRS